MFILPERRDDASAMCDEFKEFNLLSKDDSVTQRPSGYNFNWKCAPLAETKILLQPDTEQQGLYLGTAKKGWT